MFLSCVLKSFDVILKSLVNVIILGLWCFGIVKIETKECDKDDE